MGNGVPMMIIAAFNSVTAPDRYPALRIHDATQLLFDKTIFSTVDLAKAYLQIPVSPSDAL